MMNDYKCEGFEELEAKGYVSEYISINHETKTITPAFNGEGFIGKGQTVVYLGVNGYDSHRDYALKQGINVGDVLTVVKCHIGSWSSDYEFEEVEGRFNTVMFKEID